jgi:ribosomal protein S18 acetylase RimI-like enzyme
VVSLRSQLRKDDLPRIEQILRANRTAFNDVEVATALEILEAGLTSHDYGFIVAEDAQGLLGYAAYAPAPLTHGTFDLYWIAVDPRRHGKGVGRKLLRAVEQDVQARAGRLLLIETSGRADYSRTRQFYESAGYARAATIPDFYKAGDDKVIYARRLDPKEEDRTPPRAAA